MNLNLKYEEVKLNLYTLDMGVLLYSMLVQANPRFVKAQNTVGQCKILQIQKIHNSLQFTESKLICDTCLDMVVSR